MSDASSVDVLVIGGGPAGLSAARRLGAAGRTVVLLDEQPELGGQYYRRPSAAVAAAHGDHRPAGARLVEAVRRAGVEIRTSTSAWGVGDDGAVLTVHDDVADSVVARTIVIATGAYERVLPFPGWQLPGVTTPGFAQHLAGEGVPVGRRVLVAGSGPFLLPVACSLLGLGVEVVAVVEAGRPYRPAAASLAAVRFPSRLAELARYSARLARHRVPVRSGQFVRAARADRDGRLHAVELARTADPTQMLDSIAVDAICVGYGFRPQVELLRLLGCTVERDGRSGDLFPLLDPDGRTSRPGVWAAGEVGGIGGAQAAEAQGILVAEAILAEDGPPTVRPPRRSARNRRRAARFAELTGALYPAPRELAETLMAAIDDSTQVCRCEGISAGTIRAAAQEVTDSGALKAATRAGMGPCQGRECAVAVRALSALSGAEVNRSGGVDTARMPIRPVTIAALAGLRPAECVPPPSDAELTAAGGTP